MGISGKVRVFFFCIGFISTEAFAQVLKTEARSAFEYLNSIRQNPPAFSEQIGVDLSRVVPRPALLWNDTLAKVAEQKALEMGEKNYFSHVNKKGNGINILIHEAGYSLPEDWIMNRRSNFFESICAGLETGKGAINELVVDSFDKDKGHRKHLLGMNEFYSDCTHIGIGHVKAAGSQYVYYTVVIIAKKK